MLALHTYLLDAEGVIFARLTTYAEDEEDAEIFMDRLDFTEAHDSFEILEDPVNALDAATLRSVSEGQDRESPDGVEDEDDEVIEDEDDEDDEEDE